jgi:hypothetical protein
MKTSTATTDEWWTTLSTGEKDLIRALMRMVQGAKHSEIVEVARAARKWESGLTFFFKLRLKNQKWRRIYSSSNTPRTTKAVGERQIISCPSNEHNQPSASQGRR